MRLYNQALNDLENTGTKNTKNSCNLKKTYYLCTRKRRKWLRSSTE